MQTDGRDRCAGAAYLDPDGFQAMNDEWSHEPGDETLVSITERIERTTSESSVIARVGGEEFAMLLTDLDNPHRPANSSPRDHGAIGRISTSGTPPENLCPKGGGSPTAGDRGLYPTLTAGRNRSRGQPCPIGNRPVERSSCVCQQTVWYLPQR